MRLRNQAERARQGSALVTTLIVSFLLGTMALLFVAVGARNQKEGGAAGGELNSFYAAEAGLSTAWIELQNGGDGVVASADAPAHMGGLAYWVEANAVDDTVTSLVATGSDGHHQSRVELLVQDQSTGISDYGLFGERGVTLRSNSLIDSYNSGLGTYASQVSGGHAKDNGNIGTNDSISLASNAKVYGYAQYGPNIGDTISIASNVTLTDGYGAAASATVLPAIVVPSYPNLGAYTVNTNKTQTLGPGNLQYTSITTKSNSSLTIKGPCNLVVTQDVLINSNSSWIFDATNGPINVYATNNFQLKSNSTVSTTQKDPTKLTFYLSGTHTSQNDSSPSIAFSSNSQFYGTVNAPDLSVVIASNFELYGTLKAEWVELSSNSRTHFDERLAAGALNASTGYEILAWRPLNGSEAPTE